MNSWKSVSGTTGSSTTSNSSSSSFLPKSGKMDDGGVWGNCRLTHVVTSLVGHTVSVETQNGDVYEGVLRTFSKFFEIVLSQSHLVDSSDETALKDLEETQVFKVRDIVRCSALDVDLAFASKDGFQTDSEISGRTNGDSLMIRSLEQWIPEDDTGTEIETLEEGIEGWSPEDMFDENEKNHGVKSTFKANLEGYTHQLTRKDTLEYKEKEAQATQIARSIEGNSASLAAIELENGNEDEEERFSAVHRPPRRESGIVDEAGKYVPPLRRNNSKSTSPRSSGSNYHHHSHHGRRGDYGNRSSGSSYKRGGYDNTSSSSVQSSNRNRYSKTGGGGGRQEEKSHQQQRKQEKSHSDNISELVEFRDNFQLTNSEKEKLSSSSSSSNASNSRSNQSSDSVTEVKEEKNGSLSSSASSSSSSALATLTTTTTMSTAAAASNSIFSSNSSMPSTLSVSVVSSNMVHPTTTTTSNETSSPSSPSSSSSSSKKSLLNPKAKEFVLNPHAKTFTPTLTRPQIPLTPPRPQTPGTPVGGGGGGGTYQPTLVQGYAFANQIPNQFTIPTSQQPQRFRTQRMEYPRNDLTSPIALNGGSQSLMPPTLSYSPHLVQQFSTQGVPNGLMMRPPDSGCSPALQQQQQQSQQSAATQQLLAWSQYSQGNQIGVPHSQQQQQQSILSGTPPSNHTSSSPGPQQIFINSMQLQAMQQAQQAQQNHSHFANPYGPHNFLLFQHTAIPGGQPPLFNQQILQPQSNHGVQVSMAGAMPMSPYIQQVLPGHHLIPSYSLVPGHQNPHPMMHMNQ